MFSLALFELFLPSIAIFLRVKSFSLYILISESSAFAFAWYIRIASSTIDARCCSLR